MSSNRGLNLDALADAAKVEYPDAPRSSSDRKKTVSRTFLKVRENDVPSFSRTLRKSRKIRFSQRGTQTDVIASERATGFYDQSIVSSSFALSHRFFLYFFYLNTSTRCRECCEADAVGATSLGRVAAGSHPEMAAILQLVSVLCSIHETDTRRMAGNCENWSHARENMW